MINVSVSVVSSHDDGIITTLSGFVTSDVDINYNEAEYAVVNSLSEYGYDIDNVSLSKTSICNYIFTAKTRNNNYNDIMNFITKKR